VLAQNKSALIILYNPGSKGNYTIKLKVDEREMNIIGSNNATVAGDLICANPTDSSDC
jgi:hypothetical protein